VASASAQSIVEMESTIDTAPRGDKLDTVKIEPVPESLKRVERSGEDIVKIRVDPESSSPVRKSFTESHTLSTAGGSYASQAKLITSRAIELGLQMSDFQAIFNEKTKITRERFPGESSDWQAWFAESMVWGFYCKYYSLTYLGRFKSEAVFTCFTSSIRSRDPRLTRFCSQGLSLSGSGAYATLQSTIEQYERELAQVARKLGG
jgi:hypothetical protein